jgi:hypothetical protein
VSHHATFAGYTTLHHMLVFTKRWIADQQPTGDWNGTNVSAVRDKQTWQNVAVRLCTREQKTLVPTANQQWFVQLFRSMAAGSCCVVGWCRFDGGSNPWAANLWIRRKSGLFYTVVLWRVHHSLLRLAHAFVRGSQNQKHFLQPRSVDQPFCTERLCQQISALSNSFISSAF